jgi:hypothetical protein
MQNTKTAKTEQQTLKQIQVLFSPYNHFHITLIIHRHKYFNIITFTVGAIKRFINTTCNNLIIAEEKLADTVLAYLGAHREAKTSETNK